MTGELNSHKIGQLRDALCSNARVEADEKWKLLKDIQMHALSEENISTSESVTSDDYTAVLTLLIDSLRPTLFEAKWQENLFDDLFLKGKTSDAFVVLMRELEESNPSYQQKKILDLLEKFLKNDLLSSVLLAQCINGNSQVIKLLSSSGLWNELLTFLVSLPERVANKAKYEMKKIFSSTCYVPILSSSIWNALTCVYQKLKESQDCSIEFLARLLGRLCMSGHSGMIVNRLYCHLVRVCGSDFLWRRISHTLVTKIPPTSIEFFLTELLQKIEWYGCVEWLLGDAIVSVPKIQYLMTVKFLLIRQFNNNIVLQNIIGYLFTSESRKPFYNKVLNTLLDTWADESALRHQSFSQQLYLASALMVCASHLKTLKVDVDNRALIQKVLDGVQIRIGNPELKVRSMGMVIGESLTGILDPDAPKLEFDDDMFIPEALKLKELLIIPSKPEYLGGAAEVYETEIIDIDINSTKTGSSENNELNDGQTSGKDNEPLDSDDDDLEPYDMSSDEPQDSVKRPLYLRDCLQGLIEAEKPEWTEKCLRSAESLIRDNPDEVPEVAVEFCKLLLHMEDNFGMEDFIPCRHRAMIALTALCPAQVASYLTSQFYERDYNIRQRLDMLEVIAAASQEMSALKCKFIEPKPKSSDRSMTTVSESEWRQIIDKRLEEKTRRISLSIRKPVPEPELNLFGSVAGHFFYPLLEKFDRQNRSLSLLGEDSYVLGRLLYTLGIVMYSAANTVQARKMGSHLLKFIAAVRNHSEVFVRQAAIFATSTVYIAVPSFLLISELQEDVISSQSWLNEIIEKDFDVECQIRAAQTLQLLVKTIEEELPSYAETLVEN